MNSLWAQPNVKEPPSTSCLSMVAKVGVEMRLLPRSVPSTVRISPRVLNSKWDFSLDFRLIASTSLFSKAVAFLPVL